ncbi:MAG: diguanylate cyclase [Treponema sp.]|nr:diguanylate cyclase [Treponema sp.]
MSIELFENTKIINATEFDKLTSLYTTEFFFEYATLFDQHHPSQEMDAIVINFTRFHLLNQLKGRAFGDKILCAMADGLRSILLKKGGLAGRKDADTFFAYIPHIEDYKIIIEKINEKLSSLLKVSETRLRLGVYTDTERALPLLLRFDHAVQACNSIRNRAGVTMKKLPILISNIVIVAFIMIFVSLHVTNQGKIHAAANRENFVNMTISLERVTTYYLEGEQRLCNSWARYINHNNLTMQEAIEYLNTVQVVKTYSSHIIMLDSLEGLSNRAHTDNPQDHTVSYKNIDILSSLTNLRAELEPEHSTYLYTNSFDSVHVTRSYTNPANGIQSIAFCDVVNLTAGDGSLKKALLLRVIPLESISEKWSFPTERYNDAQISMIDVDGNYIIKGKSFKNSNFFEFYKSYNETDYQEVEELQELVHSAGSFIMKNSKGQDCLIAHIPVNSASDWTLMGGLALGLIILLFIDIIVFARFNKKLAVTAKAAESASRAKTDFLSTMSHDIRTPMNAIIGLTTIAEKNIGEPLQVSDKLKKIRLASNHLLTLINDILDLSKVESGHITLSPVNFSIKDTAENLINISHPLVEQKNIDFHFESHDISSEYLYADQLRINQIFINILSNALKYTPEGKSVYVDLYQTPSQKEGFIKLVYTVKDTGIGMSEEYMKKMYSPFTRQTDSRINTIQGTGLGLAITKKMVDLMEDTIECQSTEGQGTTFTVSLELPASSQMRSAVYQLMLGNMTKAQAIEKYGNF